MTDIKALIPSAKLPEVVDDSGKPVTGPELETVTGLVTQLAQLAQLARIRKSLEKEEYQGVQDSRTLAATAAYQVEDLIREYPYIPWATASFVNDSLTAPVYIGINRQAGAAKIEPGEPYEADFTKADRRIELIYYWCDTGETASVRVVGKY